MNGEVVRDVIWTNVLNVFKTYRILNSTLWRTGSQCKDWPCLFFVQLQRLILLHYSVFVAILLGSLADNVVKSPLQ